MSLQELKDHLTRKYPSHLVQVVKKDDYYSEWEEAPEQVIQMTMNDFSIVDPFTSECGRFGVDPQATYGIEKADADLIRNHNKIIL
jgi:hypothetical protein